jgi:hypothetical protein
MTDSRRCLAAFQDSVHTFWAGVGVALAASKPWMNVGAHGELVVGASNPYRDVGASPLVQVRLTGTLHPASYGLADWGPSRDWSPSELALTLELGLLWP